MWGYNDIQDAAAATATERVMYLCVEGVIFWEWGAESADDSGIRLGE